MAQTKHGLCDICRKFTSHRIGYRLRKNKFATPPKFRCEQCDHLLRCGTPAETTRHDRGLTYAMPIEPECDKDRSERLIREAIAASNPVWRYEGEAA